MKNKKRQPDPTSTKKLPKGFGDFVKHMFSVRPSKKKAQKTPTKKDLDEVFYFNQKKS